MDDTPSIADLVSKWAPEIEDSVALFEMIRRQHPRATPAMVIEELRRQAAADLLLANVLEDTQRHRD